jgi:F0F1-type ATP synthase assembly protein I
VDESSSTPAREQLFNYKKNSTWAENIAIVTQLGLTMAGCILFCFFIGFYLDKWLGTGGIFVTIFILLGVIGGGNVCYREILKITNVKKDHIQQQSDDDFH